MVTFYQHIDALRLRADKLLHKAIEDEMYKLFRKHRRLTHMCKCMGAVVLYDKNGSLMDTPAYAKRLTRLADLDIQYYSLTGHPLRLKRLPDGSIESLRDW